MFAPANGVQYLWIGLGAPDGSLVAQSLGAAGQPTSFTFSAKLSGAYIARITSATGTETGSCRFALNYLQDLGTDDAPDARYLIEATAPAGVSPKQAPPILGFIGYPQLTNVDNYRPAPDSAGNLNPSATFVRNKAGGTIYFYALSNLFGASFGDGRYHITLTRKDPPAEPQSP